MVLRGSGLILVLLLLAGCGSSPVYAPVGTRDNTQKTTPVRTTQSGTATAAGTVAPVGRASQRDHSGGHVVQRGETLYSIAWKYGLSYRELAAINNIRAPYTIYSGQQLRTTPAQGSRKKPATTVNAAGSAAVPKTAASTKPAPKPASKPVTATTSSKPARSDAQVVAVAGYTLPGSVKQWVWPAKGKVLHGFQPNSSGKKGIDIGGSKGQSVMAAADGKVVYSGSGLVGYGRLIIIKHTESLLSAYGHNSELLVSEGQQVRAGQTIARMGNSGTDRIQLYFEIRKDGKPVDPLRYLPRV